MDAVAEVRRFNRFYTRVIGLLNKHLPESDVSLAEARVLYELAKGGQATAAEITRRLAMDKAHVSRIVARFTARGYLTRRVSPAHGKQQLLSLTPAGQAAFAALERGTVAQIEGIVAPLGAQSRGRLVSAMHDIEGLLAGAAGGAGPVTLRGLVPGDIGWVIHRQAVLYHREYGWDWSYEGLAAAILARFVADFAPTREDAWIAERDGAITGSVFLMKTDDPAIGKLRLLYVEPSARGLGIGRKLVDTCIARARELGYSRLTLWTNDVLVAARRIYQAAGFRLVHEAPHRAFGHDLVEQTWELSL
ncbi:GNAT family N-acetyltransferase [Chelatococcus sp. GCM10030263]|uniref:bifunctional helix-turn-helix transcriptional regulator/GNAT family N-acetyltransferase n=1 Tax=Chelatococcus sp. GCM10030263 TaxID=3273387 RepID=UPI003613D3E1